MAKTEILSRIEALSDELATAALDGSGGRPVSATAALAVALGRAAASSGMRIDQLLEIAQRHFEDALGVIRLDEVQLCGGNACGACQACDPAFWARLEGAAAS